MRSILIYSCKKHQNNIHIKASKERLIPIGILWVLAVVYCGNQWLKQGCKLHHTACHWRLMVSADNIHGHLNVILSADIVGWYYLSFLTLFLTIDMSACLSMVPTLSVNTVKGLCQAVGQQPMPYFWLLSSFLSSLPVHNVRRHSLSPKVNPHPH